MTVNREPTADELNGVKQNTVHWPADANRVTPVDSDGGEITPTNPFDITTGFSIPAYDYIELTYVAAGNGAGEIERVVYKTGGSGGTTVATLTLTYNADNEIATVTKT